MRSYEFIVENAVPGIDGPFKVTSFDPKTRMVRLENQSAIQLADNIKDVPTPGYNYSFVIKGNQALRMLLLTVDNVITTGREILLIKRKKDPFAGHWALPGGFIDPGESPEEAAHRELQEETGLTVNAKMKFVGRFDEVGRDPRMSSTWSYAFTVQIPKEAVVAGDDASEAKWIPISSISSLPMAFDHKKIIQAALRI
jgi:8-oxo-dGTP diphosphatase